MLDTKLFHRVFNEWFHIVDIRIDARIFGRGTAYTKGHNAAKLILVILLVDNRTARIECARILLTQYARTEHAIGYGHCVRIQRVLMKDTQGLKVQENKVTGSLLALL